MTLRNEQKSILTPKSPDRTGGLVYSIPLHRIFAAQANRNTGKVRWVRNFSVKHTVIESRCIKI